MAAFAATLDWKPMLRWGTVSGVMPESCFAISRELFVVVLSAVIVAANSRQLQGQASEGLPKPAALPAQAELPDPLVMLDGRRVTTREMWFEERRPELLRLFQHYMYGQLPPKPGVVSGKVERTDRAAFGGKAKLSEVAIRFGRPEVPPIHLMLVVPNRRTNPAPVVLGMNYFGNHTLVRDKRVRLADSWMPERGAGVVSNRATEASRGTWADVWRIEEIIDRGYALATFYNGDIDPDTTVQRGLQKFFPASVPADTGACVRFVPRSNQVEYVNFTGKTDAGNNTSGVGFQPGAKLDINITAFWWRQGEWMPAHELGHALGFHHEHQRWDRDQFVTIHYEHIKAGREHDYHWIPKTNWIVSSTAYDYRSIMHYRTCWTSSCESQCKDGDGGSPCAVIDPVGTDFDGVIGQWGDNRISATDAEKLRLVYGSVEKRDGK